MPRNSRSFSRKSGFRDSKLIVVSCEGHNTERDYFEALASPKYFANAKIHVEVLQREDPSNSAPNHVIAEIDSFRKKYSLNRRDELWLVFDVDRWPVANLAEVCRLALQKGYFLAISNPRFELWLLLHLINLNQLSESDLESLCSQKNNLEAEILRINGSYNKAKIVPDAFIPYVQVAIDRAKQLKDNQENRWPLTRATRVYQLVSRIVNLSN